jgi:hypothetical protein
MTKLPIVKDAIIRRPAVRPCPFGLGISTGCHNAGDTVKMMTPLKDVSEELQKKQKTLNIRTYAANQKGERCIYADRIVEGHDTVNCDFLDTGEGEQEFAAVPSGNYPRLFGYMGQHGIYSYTLNSFSDNFAPSYMFSGMLGAYASAYDEFLNKNENEDMAIKDNMVMQEVSDDC